MSFLISTVRMDRLDKERLTDHMPKATAKAKREEAENQRWAFE